MVIAIDLTVPFEEDSACPKCRSRSLEVAYRSDPEERRDWLDVLCTNCRYSFYMKTADAE